MIAGLLYSAVAFMLLLWLVSNAGDWRAGVSLYGSSWRRRQPIHYFAIRPREDRGP